MVIFAPMGRAMGAVASRRATRGGIGHREGVVVDMLQEYPMVGRIPPNTPAFLPLYLGRQDYTALMSLIPVTILTGFLGSGKTTLLKRVLTEAHGQRIAVIENEFGEENIDNEILVADTEEHIVQMNNGCVCCTIREDLRETLADLAKPDVRERLHTIWTAPDSLDPARRSAQVTRDVAEVSTTRVLYVSPLRALAFDVEKNLRAPIVGIRHAAERLGHNFREPAVALRTGDTSARDRQRMLRHPPDVLITTPESLYLMLTSSARSTLANIDTVIIDDTRFTNLIDRGRNVLTRVNLGANEILQMAVLEPKLAILDETDSGLDIDALRTVGDGINRIMRKPDKAVLLITHYQRLLDYVKPDFVHVLDNGRITRTGGAELALELERDGYKELAA